MDYLKNILKNPLNNFDQIANHLMHSMLLNINGDHFQICEIEFYLNNKQHPDVFTHTYDMQLTNAKWYFHQSSNRLHSYKGGNYKGLDITCGSIDSSGNKSYGGILIRSIIHIETLELIEGPCCVVNHILKLMSCTNITDLVTIKLNQKIDIDHPNFGLIEHLAPSITNDLFQSPRIGLTLKKDDELDKRIYYIGQLYRYVVNSNLIKKGRSMVNLIGGYQNKIKNNTSLIKKIEYLKNKVFEIEDYRHKDLNDDDRFCLYLNSLKISIPQIKPKIKMVLKCNKNV